MERYIYTAMSGALYTLGAQRIQANNLANSGTGGFRADFARAETHRVEGPGFATRFLSMQQVAGSNFAGGRLEATGRKLDVALQGPGFLAVEAAGGEAYTRAGHLELDATGMLTVNGRPVLGEDGPLQLPEFRDITIGEDGTITLLPAEGNDQLEAGRIKLVNPPLADLRKGDDGLFHLLDGAAEELPLDEQVRLASGYLEGSNVSAVDAMIDTLALSRNFEMQVRMMKTADELSAAGSRLVRGA